MVGAEPPQALADDMHGAWVSFVKTGRPGWPAYGNDRTVRSFGTTSTTVTDPGRTAAQGLGRDPLIRPDP